jgi:hypothetical protein
MKSILPKEFPLIDDSKYHKAVNSTKEEIATAIK